MSHKNNILTYLGSERRGKAANELERQAHNDAFLNDALDGFASVNNDAQTLADINKLQKNLLLRTKKRPHSNIFRVITTSAAVLLVFITGYWFLQKNTDTQQLAVLESKIQQTEIAETTTQQKVINDKLIADDSKEDDLPEESPSTKKTIAAKSTTKRDKTPTSIAVAVERNLAEEIKIDGDKLASNASSNLKDRDDEKLVKPITVTQFDQSQYSNPQNYILGQSQGDLSNSKLLVGQLSANQSLYRLSGTEQGNILDVKLFSSKQNQSFLDNQIANNNQNISQSQYYGLAATQKHSNNINNQFNRQIAQNQANSRTTNNNAEGVAESKIAEEKVFDEVVVTGYAKKRKASVAAISKQPINSLNEKELQPVIGMEKYQEYLKSDLVYPADALEKGIKGKVTLSFLIGNDGMPYDIEIEKSLSESCDKEAIRLVIQGSKWNPANNNLAKRIKLKINFEQ